MAKLVAVKLTANFERNLTAIEQFLLEAEAFTAFDRLLDQLLETVIPHFERFPDMGRPFLERSALSVEGTSALEGLRKKLRQGVLREYLLADYLVLYARYDQSLYLLSIKHHRQLSFDFDSLWGDGPVI